MLRSTFVIRAVAAAATTAENTKPMVLHKLLIGEAQFKNKALLKECNVVHQFGESWQSELEAYSKTLAEDKRKILQRQVARLALTRYTMAELAQFCGEGPQQLDQVARKANIAQGVAFLRAKGSDTFEQYVKMEAGNANWKPEEAQKFIDAVKAAAK